MTTVGSRPARFRIWATMEVVEVLPWAPDMAMAYLMRMSSASISARGMMGIPLLPGRSNFRVIFREMAVEVTMTLAPLDLFLLYGRCMWWPPGFAAAG